jgi:hypothetical protein
MLNIFFGEVLGVVVGLALEAFLWTVFVFVVRRLFT